MIPSTDAFLVAYRFIARRYQRMPIANRAAVERARQLALSLSTTPPSEPAALFFAFASTRAAFPAAWRLMSALLAARQAQMLGYNLQASQQDLEDLCTEVLYQRTDFPRVATWFAARLEPSTPPEPNLP